MTKLDQRGGEVGKSDQSEKAERQPGHGCDCGCQVTINIEANGDVIINNCAGSRVVPDSAPADSPAPPGACIPVVPGAKHKQSRDYKLGRLAAGERVPSVLAAAAFHTSRRFLAGRSPANTAEESVYATLRRMPRGLLACAIDAVDQMGPHQRARLIDGSLSRDLDEPISETDLAQAFAAELVQRIGQSLFADPEAGEEERPGKIRVYKPLGEDFFSQVRICSVNGIRTADFIPPIAIGDRLPGEIQRDCSAQIVNGESQVVCVNRSTDCPGGSLGQVCARVVDFTPGEAVTLEGVNFFSTDAKVRLQDPDGTVTRDVDCHVWGDVDTPVTEDVGGESRLINDCRVHDRIVFRVPDDLPPGLWRVWVVVPNVTPIPELGTEIGSNVETINVLVPDTANFTIAVRNISARKETSPSWAGSDEVGLVTFAAAFDRDLNLLPLSPTSDNPTTFRQSVRGDFDTGTDLFWERLIFEHDQPFVALSLVVLGDEIDSERFYSDKTSSAALLFIEVIAAEFAAAGTAFKIAGVTLASMGSGALIATGAAAAVLIAIAVAVAIWAPADPLIRDSMGFSVNDLAMLTNVSIPAPDRRTFTAADKIEVNVNTSVPPVKEPFQYLETREYVSDAEDSRYGVVYRFNRLA